MSSPEKKKEEEEEEEEVPGLQLVFGNSVVKPQTPHTPPEDAEPQELSEYYSTETLCLSRTELKHVAQSILKNSKLKYLYLEGNQLSSIPDSLFISLPNLLWLDLRNNQITSLPAEIGSHRSLKTLLLEGNPISELPPELGNVITLKGLNLRDCPISFPPQHIVNQGLRSILQFLRSAMAKRPVSMRKTPPELPVVEKLQLSELMGSSMEEQDESVDEDELQRFKELKQKMILLDKAELGSVARGDGNPKSCRLAITKRSQEALRKWHTQAQTTQEKKMPERKQKAHERQRKREEAETDSEPDDEDRSDAPRIQMPGFSVTEWEEDRSARRLERQISAHVEKMQQRRRNRRGTTTEQMAAAEQDVEEMRKLQARLLEKKRNRGRNSFTIFTGDTWQSFLEKQ
ncbi:leucine-rich repeat-containing protein 27-like isoform X2 [Dicentrarchus labrax]|uniref:Leucine-rich repeat-containing protein 27 n=1 Tax=Dicentrarchus labrax TaxID=13489 RepID=A0A8C4EPG0_DICLA|nr:leucine-rich repeat-containing protein 27-like isoform X2 [Dicentrarchus labrax]